MSSELTPDLRRVEDASSSCLNLSNLVLKDPSVYEKRFLGTFLLLILVSVLLFNIPQELCNTIHGCNRVKADEGMT